MSHWDKLPEHLMNKIIMYNSHPCAEMIRKALRYEDDDCIIFKCNNDKLFCVRKRWIRYKHLSVILCNIQMEEEYENYKALNSDDELP
jgi:hypothetical protein